jgi:hypothetical protein
MLKTNGISHLIENLFGPFNHAKDSKQSKGVDINGKKAEEQDIQKDTEVIRL